MIIRSVLILVLIFSNCQGIARKRLYEVCETAPRPAFCDSHIFGKVAGKRKPVVGPERAVDERFKEMMDWLDTFKDSVDDDDDDYIDLETSKRVHSNAGEYCSKYKTNFNSYCINANSEALEGVLPQFCAIYRKTCNLPEESSGGEGFMEEEFPDPPNLEKDFKPKATTTKSVSFSGSPEEYCGKYKPNYQNLCQPFVQSKAAEFCQSYRHNCEEDSGSSTNSTFVEGEGSDENAEVKSKVYRYCQKYSENYNFYCVGGSSEENQKFCDSFKKNCPDKASS